MEVLSALQPRAVFHYFEELCAIPHGSGNTKAVSDWCAAFARARGLEYHQDALNNIIIIKEAAPGYEGAEPVILQGHLDMVCEKEPGCPKDLEREGLDLEVGGGFVTARGTTLGGDDGIAVAMALALLDARDIPHPRLEVVLTVDEEVGMLGAAALDVSPLRGRTLINLDSEEEGVFTVSCAGGNRTECILPVKREPFSGTVLTVTVGGLTGGHSGTEIHRGRANANVLLGRCLRAVSARTELRLGEAAGGSKDNAIPTASVALVAADAGAVQAVCAEMDAAFKKEYRVNDPAITVSARPAESSLLPMDEASSRSAVCLLACLPNGIQAMSADMPGLVQTSLNLGILTTGDDAVHASFSVRSSVATQKQMLIDRLRCLTESLGGSVSTHGEYPGWEFMPQSPLRDLMVQVFTDQYGYAPKVEAIHAGLECGLFSAKLPGLDCVSFGPDLKEIHTFRESLSVSSVQRVYAMVVETLKRMH
mgnify:CR=1 FL=1